MTDYYFDYPLSEGECAWWILDAPPCDEPIHWAAADSNAADSNAGDTADAGDVE